MNETRIEHLEVTQGDDWESPLLTLELSQGNIIDAELVMTIRDGIGGPVLVQISTTADVPTGAVLGVVIVDETHAKFTLTKAQTSALPSERTFVYDVQVTLPSGVEKTPVKGDFFVGWQATY